jgi:tetratricopeptide (TPR) repeat protein
MKSGLRIPPWALLTLIFILGLGLRLVYLAEVRDVPLLRELLVDAAAYDEWARAIAAGDWIGAKTFYQDPLYPYFLAVLYKLIGRRLLVIYALQMAIAAAAVLPLYGLARRSFNDARVGLLAALLWAGYKVDFFFDAQIEKTSPGIVLVIATLWLLLVARDRPRWWLTGLAGALAGTWVVFRGNYLAVVPFLIAWLAVTLYRRHGRAALAPIVACIVGWALIPGLTMLRNYAVSGQASLTTAQGGVNFYVGNNRENKWGAGHDPEWARRTPVFEQDDFLAEAKRRTGRKEMTLVEMDRFWYREGLREIAADPGLFFARLGRKLLIITNHDEVPDNLPYDFIREYFAPILKFPLPAFWLAGPLGFAGAALAARRRRGGLLLAYLGSYLATLLIFYVVGRYRMPIVPPLLVLAAYGLISLPGLVRTRDRKALGLYLGALVLAGGLAAPRWFPPVYDLAWQKLGHAYSKEGDWTQAIKAYEQSLSINPNWGQSWLGLGLAYEARHRDREALDAFAHAAQLDPRHAGSHFLYARALERAGDPESAIAEYRQALALDPELTGAADALRRLQPSAGP